MHLYRQDVSLQNYFQALDFDVFSRPRDSISPRTSINPLKAWSFHAADKATRMSNREGSKRILFFSNALLRPQNRNSVSYSDIARLGENRGRDSMLASHHTRPSAWNWKLNWKPLGVAGKLNFWIPECPSVQWTSACGRSRRNCELAWPLQKQSRYLSHMGSARRVAPWRVLKGLRATLRHGNGLRLQSSLMLLSHDVTGMTCAVPFAGLAMQRGKPVITFQQGVVDYTMDVPIVASKFVAFGASSASVLAE